MTAFLLIRHASNPTIGHTVAGRRPGVELDATGRAEAEALAGRLGRLPIAAVYASPLERARQTAEPLARARGLAVTERDALLEVDYGDWAGESLETLRTLPGWREWNSYRTGTRVPRGELMLEVQLRMVAELERLRVAHPGQAVAVVSHGDPIKAVLGHYLGIPIELQARLDIAPASVSVLRLEEWGAQALSIGDTGTVRLPAAG